MKVVLAGGSGFIGKHLAQEFRAAGYEVVFLTRSPEKADEVFWDAQTLGPWTAQLEGARAVVNLAGKSISSKWTDANKREILNSRVQGTQVIGQAIGACQDPPKAWINANAMGFYGDRGEEVLTEDSSPGVGFLSEVCKAWEEPLWNAETPATRKISLRIGFVLGKNGGGLPVLEKLTKAFLGGSLGSGKQWLSWIHMDDLASIFRWCAEREASGAYNATAPHPSRNGEFMKTLRKVQHRPWSPPAPELVLRALGKVMAPDPSLGLISAKVLPERALKEGFRFRHPELREALESLFYPSDPTADVELFHAMNKAIDHLLADEEFATTDTAFSDQSRAIRDELQRKERLPHFALRDLWEFAGDYYDSYSHGFPDLDGMSWEEAKDELDAKRLKAREALWI